MNITKQKLVVTVGRGKVGGQERGTVLRGTNYYV